MKITAKITLDIIGISVFLTISYHCSLLAAILPESDKAHTSPIPLVTVNADTIYSTDVEELFFKVHKKQTAGEKDDFDYRKLLDKLLHDRLLIQEARSLGMDEEESLLDQLKKSRKRNAVRQFIRDRFKPDLEVGEKAILDYFLSNYSRMQIRTISIADREQADQLLSLIESGARMDSIANEISLDMYRYRGGLHNLKHAVDMEVDLRNQASHLKPGDLSSPFPYRRIYAFLRLEHSIPADTSELLKFRHKIISVLRQKKRDVAWEVFLDKLRGKTPVQQDSLVIKKIVADSALLFDAAFLRGARDIALAVDSNHYVIELELRRKILHSAMTMGNEPFRRIFEYGIQAEEEELLLATAADNEGYDNHPSVNETYHKSMDSALVETYLKEIVAPRIKFNRTELESYYLNHIEEFRNPTGYRLDQLFVSDEKLADEIVLMLDEGADFNYIVKKHGLEVVKTNDENQWITLQSFPDQVRREIEMLKIGESCGAFPTTEESIIIRLRDRQLGDIRSLEEVEMKIREVMFQWRFDEILDKTLDILKLNSKIEYNEKAIETYFGSG